MKALTTFAAAIAIGGLIAASPSEAATVLQLDEAIAIAIADNPNLAQMQARYEARSAIPAQVGTLPDVLAEHVPGGDVEDSPG